MRPLGTLLGISALCILLLSVGSVLQGSRGPALWAMVNELDYQLLTNPGMEDFDARYTRFSGVDCQVASGWQRFWYDASAPCWMDTRVFAASHLGGGWVERIEGDTSQMLVSTQPYTAGLWQQVGGLTPGVGYGFHAAMLTIFQTSAGEPDHGTMIKQVGLDPTGGTDPTAPTVVWSEADGRDMRWSIDLRTAVWAETETATVFIRVISPNAAGDWPFMNLSFLDSAILAQTPSVSATSPDESESATFQVRWDNVAAAPGATSLRWFDVQWMDEADGVWHDWLTRIDVSQVQASFTGQRGHAYRFRARVWQRYTNGAHLVSPYRPDGDTRTFVQGSKLMGLVLSNEGHPIVDATVAMSGTQYAAVSGGGGYYEIWPFPSTQPRTVTVDHPAWLAPAPVHGLILGLNDTVVLDWTLRPPDDAVQNGGFEDGLGGWAVSHGQVGTPTLVADPVHTGRAALALGGNATLVGSNGVSQTVALAGSWEPSLAFWYRPAAADPTGDAFSLVLTVTTETTTPDPAFSPVPGAGAGVRAPLSSADAVTYHFTPTLGVADWQHVHYHIGPEEYLTGTVTIGFQVWNDGDGAATTVYVDEVSFGRTPGGPHRSYLPVILRGY